MIPLYRHYLMLFVIAMDFQILSNIKLNCTILWLIADILNFFQNYFEIVYFQNTTYFKDLTDTFSLLPQESP